MIEVKNITKNFGKLKVLDNLNLQLNKGECIALIGPNGCGKTTLIKSILGMVLPSDGDIFFNGKSIKNDNEYRNNIGSVSYTHLDVYKRQACCNTMLQTKRLL